MRKSDDNLRALIIKHLATHRGAPVMWVPIESSSTASGIPDLWGCWRGRTVWIECKATPGWALTTLTEFQAGFLLRLDCVEGHGFIVTRRRCTGGPRHLAADEIWIHNGYEAPRLRAGGLLAAEPLLRAEGGPGAWDWVGVGVTLFGG